MHQSLLAFWGRSMAWHGWHGSCLVFFLSHFSHHARSDHHRHRLEEGKGRGWVILMADDLIFCCCCSPCVTHSGSLGVRCFYRGRVDGFDFDGKGQGRARRREGQGEGKGMKGLRYPWA
ncbi:hypothetical protein QBC39DRAFT_73665 [Podospora conica]|nr:hypothetical protein QBC39DRAFT_73665 [Schizothecium conicum]